MKHSPVLVKCQGKREGRPEGVELLEDLHRVLKTRPPSSEPPPLLKKRPTSCFPLTKTLFLTTLPPLLKNPPSLLKSMDAPS